MLLGGLWHGAGWNFIIWGGFHGLLLLVFHRIEKPWQRLSRALRHAVMLPLILASWIPFRMHTLADLGTFFRRATFRPDAPHAPLALWLYACLGVAVCALPKNSNDIEWELGWRETIAFAALAVVAILHLNLSSKFIYFAF
jgi:alginate O-acetyltransferase complex protein AlgI